MSFIWPQLLLLLLVVPVCLLLYRQLLIRRRRARRGLGALGYVQNQASQIAGWRRHVPFGCFLLGLTLSFVGLARPEAFVSLPRVEGTVILAFDVSNSMSAADLAPTRMEAAKEAARRFVENQPTTIQIGVIAFSNGGVIVQQPTNIQGDILATIDRLSPQGGTSLSQGMFTAINAIAGETLALDEDAFAEGTPPQIGSYESAVILLFTDGEDTNEANPLQVAQIAAEAGIRIYPIGIGTAQGAILEIDGFNIVTQLDERPLQQIAALTNGEYYPAGSAEALGEIYQTVDLQLTIAGDQIEITAIFASVALLLLLLGGALTMVWFGRVP